MSRNELTGSKSAGAKVHSSLLGLSETTGQIANTGFVPAAAATLRRINPSDHDG